MAKLTKDMAKSFVKGLTSFMIIWPGPIAPHSTISVSDTKKLVSDWKAIGCDLKSALDKYGREYTTKRNTGWV